MPKVEQPLAETRLQRLFSLKIYHRNRSFNRCNHCSGARHILLWLD
ncbi:MAG: hypothetical protein AB1393_02855 [Candidatus Edwardsbacteria bacterium]